MSHLPVDSIVRGRVLNYFVAAIFAFAAMQSVTAHCQTEKVLYSFCKEQSCADGNNPESDLINVNGRLYGTTYWGGNENNSNCRQSGCGTVFAFDPATGTETVLYSFVGGDDGSDPIAGVVDVKGILYGTTKIGGNTFCGCGTVFSVDPKTDAETVLYAFCQKAGCADGEYPEARLLALGDKVFGTTTNGGTGCNGNGCGVVFSIDMASDKEKVIHEFQSNGEDGSNPTSGLIDVAGTLYGTTQYGGGGAGTIYELNPSTGSESVLYAFDTQNGGSDGLYPWAGLLYARGIFYGTTWAGGGRKGCGIGCGTVFSFSPGTGVETVLHRFSTHHDAVGPQGDLVLMGGILYGTTFYSGDIKHCFVRGAPGCGAVYSLDPKTGSEAMIYAFCRVKNCRDGALPAARLIAIHGTLYGTTTAGGAHGGGTIFSITP